MENNTSAVGDNTGMLRYFSGEHVERNCTLFDFVFYTLLIGTLSVLGILGNILSIVVLQKDEKNKVAAFLLQSLAVADSLVLLTSFLVLSMIYGLLPFVERSEWSAIIIPYIVKYVHPFGYMGQCATIWMTVLLAVNRFIAIVKPFLTSKLCTLYKARLQVVIVLSLAVGFNTPRFFQYDIVTENDQRSNRTAIVLNETAIGEYSLFGVIYTNIIYTVIVLIVPCFILIILNTWMLHDIKCTTKKPMSYSSTTSINSTVSTKVRRRLSIGAPPLPEEDNITAIMITIIVIFLCCHTPDRIFQIVRYFFASYEQVLCGETLYYVSSVCNLLIVINSSTNFIIYYMMRRRFRKVLLMKLCAWRNLTTYKEPPSYMDFPHAPPPLLRRHTDNSILIHSVQPNDNSAEQADVKRVKLLIKTGSAPSLF